MFSLSWLTALRRLLEPSQQHRLRPRSFRPCLESLEIRTVPSTLLFQDTFHTPPNPNSDGWYDVNHGIYNTSRQSGLLAPIPYVEPDITATGGSFDFLTQVNNPGLPNTLLLATAPVGGQSFSYVSPVQDFAASGLSVENLHVAIDPLGPGSSGSSDSWAALVFGTAPGSFITGEGTGVLVRASGEYELWDRCTLVNSGNVGAKTNPQQFYAVDFAITPTTGQYTLSIDGQQLFTGTHGVYTTNYVTLEDLAGFTPTGVQTNYFADLTISGTSEFGAITARPNTTYFVSPDGNDNNAGTSPDDAWRSIARVNRENFRPGDRILFEGGSTFAGNLAFGLGSQGSAGDSITVGSYGGDKATIAAGKGAGFAVTDSSYFTIEDLNVVGSGFASNGADGIQFVNEFTGRTLVDLAVHDVNVSGFGQVGMEFTGLNNSGDFVHVQVTDSSANDNGAGGVQLLAQDSNNASDIYIGHVRAIHNAGTDSTDSGYGILVFGATDVVIEYSVTGDNGWLPGNQGETGGIEAIADNRVLLQHNESYANHPGNSDGDGIILDVTTDSIMQFNYSHDNDGAGLFLFAEEGFTATNNVIRYNISQNDGRRPLFGVNAGIFVGADVSNADIYNNTVFMAPSPVSSEVAIQLFVTGSSIHIRNNLFVTTGGSAVVSSDGGGTDILFQGNDYWSSGSLNQFIWGDTTYVGLDGPIGWRTNIGQETLNGAPVGFEVDPLLKNPGGGGTIGNADLLFTLFAYQLKRTSPVHHAGLDLSQFVSWDPYGYANDAFLSAHFNSRPTDFYGNALPAAGSGQFSIGADQKGRPKES
jgi:hypothetical protein